jgi:hypothetical protein
MQRLFSREDVPDRVIERVLTRATRDAETGCLTSQYSVGSHGYAQVGWHDDDRRTMVLVHRVAWVAQRGSIPEGMTVDHLCKNKRCLNVEHLRLLSNFENARRTFGRDWPIGECVNGHPNSELEFRAGHLNCRECRRVRRRAIRAGAA